MARRYKKKGRSAKAKPSILSAVPIVVLGAGMFANYQAGGIKEMGRGMVTATTGFDPMTGNFNAAWAMPFYGSVAGTYVAKKLVGYAGINRALKGLPFRL